MDVRQPGHLQTDLILEHQRVVGCMLYRLIMDYIQLRGMFYLFHAFVSRASWPNVKKQSEYVCPISENYLWGNFQHFSSFMACFIWTLARLEPWNVFEVAWQFSSWLLSIVLGHIWSYWSLLMPLANTFLMHIFSEGHTEILLFPFPVKKW